MLIAIISQFFRAALMAAVLASLTALSKARDPGVKYFGRFKAAYPVWLAAMCVLGVFYFQAWMQGKPPGSVPGLFIIGMLVLGGWGAFMAVKAARSRPGRQEMEVSQ